MGPACPFHSTSPNIDMGPFTQPCRARRCASHSGLDPGPLLSPLECSSINAWLPPAQSSASAWTSVPLTHLNWLGYPCWVGVPIAILYTHLAPSSVLSFLTSIPRPLLYGASAAPYTLHHLPRALVPQGSCLLVSSITAILHHLHLANGR